MTSSVLEIPRAVRRRLKRLSQKPSEHGRRALGILTLWQTGNCVSEASRRMQAARSTLQRWRALFEDYGEEGLRPLERGRRHWKSSDKALDALAKLLQSQPQDHGYLRSRWNLLDFLVVVSGLSSFLPGEAANLSGVRMLRLMRPLRALARFKNLQVPSQPCILIALPLP